MKKDSIYYLLSSLFSSDGLNSTFWLLGVLYGAAVFGQFSA